MGQPAPPLVAVSVRLVTIDASVIIPAHNAEAVLARQLDALAGQVDAPGFEVIVVLNRCTDRSAQVALQFSSQLHLRIVEADRTGSAAYARNSGVGASKAPVLLFCDADDRVDQRWLASMLSALETSGADFAGGRIIVDRHGLPNWIYRWRYQDKDGKCIQQAHVPFAMSASLACRRAALEAVGGFDESFVGAGSEEVDLAARMLRAGLRIGEAPDAAVFYSPRTSLRGAMQQSRGYARGELALQAKESRLGPPPTRVGIAKRLGRLIERRLIREGERHLDVLFSEVVDRYYRLNEHRRLFARQIPPSVVVPPVDEFIAPTSTVLIGGLALSARPAQARWYGSGGVEQRSLAVVEALLDEGGTFVDCGANVGVFTLAAAMRVGPKGRVITFEPDPRSLSLLRRNLERHRVLERVEIHAQAVGGISGQQMFNLYENDVVSGFGFAPEIFSPGALVEKILVEVVTLDESLDMRVDIIKVDVEGFEPAVLRGADRLLAGSDAPTLIIELNPAVLESAGHSLRGLLDLLPAERWARWIIDERAPKGAGSFTRLDDRTLDLLGQVDRSWFANLLAVPLARAAEVEAVLEDLTQRVREKG